MLSYLLRPSRLYHSMSHGFASKTIAIPPKRGSGSKNGLKQISGTGDALSLITFLISNRHCICASCGRPSHKYGIFVRNFSMTGSNGYAAVRSALPCQKHARPCDSSRCGHSCWFDMMSFLLVSRCCHVLSILTHINTLSLIWINSCRESHARKNHGAPPNARRVVE